MKKKYIDADIATQTLEAEINATKSIFQKSEECALVGSNALGILESIPPADVVPAVRITPRMQEAIDMLVEERKRQVGKWGYTKNEDSPENGLFQWMSILSEEMGKLCEAVNETCFDNPNHPERGGRTNVLKKSVRVAAVALAIVEQTLSVRNDNIAASPSEKSIVRCKDCYFCDEGSNVSESWCWCRSHRMDVYADFFCGDGTPKEN